MPTKSVRVIVLASSGCCTMALSAWANARPSPKAGTIEPIAIASPEARIKAAATSGIMVDIFGCSQQKDSQPDWRISLTGEFK